MVGRSNRYPNDASKYPASEESRRNNFTFIGLGVLLLVFVLLIFGIMRKKTTVEQEFGFVAPPAFQPLPNVPPLLQRDYRLVDDGTMDDLW